MWSFYLKCQWGKTSSQLGTDLRQARGVRAPGAPAHLGGISGPERCARSRPHPCPGRMARFLDRRTEGVCVGNRMGVGEIESVLVLLSG